MDRELQEAVVGTGIILLFLVVVVTPWIIAAL